MMVRNYVKIPYPKGVNKTLADNNCQALSPNPYSQNRLGPTQTKSQYNLKPKRTGADTKML